MTELTTSGDPRCRATRWRLGPRELFGVRLPIVQTGMGWVSGASLTAATSEAGGLGILASATMTLAELRTAIDKVATRTSNPFGVNLLPNQPDAAERIEPDRSSARCPVASLRRGAPSRAGGARSTTPASSRS